MPPTHINITECYPIEYHYIKALFLQGQYRRCIQACHDILEAAKRNFEERPLQDTFVSFYLGLCHDAIARSSHVNSVAKIPGLDTAEQFYQAAINAIPSAKDARFFCRKQLRSGGSDPFLDGGASDDIKSPTLTERFDTQSSRASSPASQSRVDSPQVLSPVDSPQTLPSDAGALESDESFSELMTPNRVQRDASKMSLLEGLQKPMSRDVEKVALSQQHLPRDLSRMSLLEATPPLKKATSHGLMRPIRPGSPPKQYHIPPKLPSAQLGSKLPTLASRTKTAPQLGAHRALSPEPVVSPLSHVGSDMRLDDASTISAMSDDPKQKYASSDAALVNAFDETAYSRFTDHLSDLREQLETHITLVQEVKRQLQHAKVSTASEKSKSLPQARSYWSFVPKDVKESEKQRRVQEGRERGWKRERFDARRYQELCEKALAEL